MATAPEKSPSPEEERELHRHLVERAPTALADLAIAFLDQLIAWLLETNAKQVSEHSCVEAAEDALIALVKNPDSYQSDRNKTLFSYLQMSAQGDLRNGMRREKNKTKRNVGLDVLELSSEGWKYLGRTDDQLLRLENNEELRRADAGVLTPARAGLSPEESAALDLILEGERKTEVFARVLRMDHLSKAEQRLAVKKVKDKLKSRIKRERVNMASHLEALAKRLEDDPFFLACTLKLYAQSEDLDDLGLTKALECTTETLTLLRLCRTPEPSSFKADIEQIVSRFQVNRTALVQAVRRGHAIAHLQRSSTEGRDMLLAARDGDQETEPDKPHGGGP